MADNSFIKGAETMKRFEIKRYGYSLVFELSPDEVECVCFYEPATTGGSPLTGSELNAHLSQFKISEGIIPEATARLLTSAASGTAVEGLLIARGNPMVPGEDGQLVIVLSDDLEKDGTAKEENAAVDLRHVQAFLNVESGALVARIEPPGCGKSGRTVTGKSIPPQAGIPVKPDIGQNIRLDDDGKSLYATDTGRFCQRNSSVSVEDTYEIDGDVDFKVGNIAFKGYVEVKGDVLDGFFVKATKGIKIHGNIGVSTIESEGDISFCGMSGQGSGIINCSGSIFCNYIYDSHITCAGDITATVEIRSSHIKCLGMITVSNGGITGGEYFALAGIQCANLGSVTSLRTRVVAGVHYGDLEELNALFNELKLLVAEFSSAPKGSIDPKEFSNKRTSITERTNEVRSRTYTHSNPKINVEKKLYEGVTITLGMTTDNVLEERKGPVSIIANSIEGGFRYLGMTPLSFNASMIEETFVNQQKLEQLNTISINEEEVS